MWLLFVVCQTGSTSLPPPPLPPLCVSRVMKVASRYAGRGLTFSVANRKDFLAELEEDFGLSDGGELPVVTIRTKMGHKFTMREEFT